MTATTRSMPPAPTGDAQPSTRERVRKVIEAIRPSVQSDGGDIELVDVSADGVVRIRLHGACVGCPSAAMTLRLGVERNLKEYVPAVREVVSVD